MSMLSAQCAELRDKAKLLRGHADGLKAPYVIPSTKELMALTMLDSATRMDEAADTIISLRDRLQAAELGSGTCKLIDTTSPCNDDYWNSAKCNECGAEFTCAIFGRGSDTPDADYCPSCGRKVVNQ